MSSNEDDDNSDSDIDLKKYEQEKMQHTHSDNPLFDLKPYFRKVQEWELRLKRLEMKVACLDPALIHLSLTMHEKALDLLNAKLYKFIDLETEWLESQDQLSSSLIK